MDGRRCLGDGLEDGVRYRQVSDPLVRRDLTLTRWGQSQLTLTPPTLTPPTLTPPTLTPPTPDPTDSIDSAFVWRPTGSRYSVLEYSVLPLPFTKPVSPRSPPPATPPDPPAPGPARGMTTGRRAARHASAP